MLRVFSQAIIILGLLQATGIYFGTVGSVMCDVIKIGLSLFYGFPFQLLLSAFPFRRIFMTSHMTLSAELVS